MQSCSISVFLPSFPPTSLPTYSLKLLIRTSLFSSFPRFHPPMAPLSRTLIELSRDSSQDSSTTLESKANVQIDVSPLQGRRVDGDSEERNGCRHRKRVKISQADGGKDAWLFLAGCFVFEALIWGSKPPFLLQCSRQEADIWQDFLSPSVSFKHTTRLIRLSLSTQQASRSLGLVRQGLCTSSPPYHFILSKHGPLSAGHPPSWAS